MDGASSKYVAELLKQLEDLKRKKAHKERKLMKLKSCPSKSPQNSKTLSNSPSSSCKKTDSKIVYQAVRDENHDNQKGSANSGALHTNLVEREKCHPFLKEKNKENLDSLKVDLRNCEPNFTAKNHSDIETGICKSIEIANFNREHMKTHFVGDKIIKNISLGTEAISTKKHVIKECLLDNENSDKFVEHNDANKTPILTSEKNKNPESPEDPLDCNMSYFISSDVLLDSCNDKEKIIKNVNNVCETTNIASCPKQIEMGIELITSDLKISPPSSVNPSSNESQQNNFGNFNFPKFSTPTDVNMSQSNNAKIILDNLQEKHETSRNIFEPSYKISENYATDPKENNPILDKPVENEVLKNKFHSSPLKFILGSGLSSVLDAHYGSPGKQTESKSDIFHNVSDDGNKFSSQQATNEVVLKKRLLPDDNTVSNFKQKSKFLDESVLFSTLENGELHRNKKMASDKEYARVKSNTPFTFDKALESDNAITNEDLNFDTSIVLCSQFDSFTDSQNISSEVKCSENDLHNNILSQVTEAMDELIAKVCENILNRDFASNFEEIVETNLNINTDHDNITFDSEILVIPETEGLGLYFSKDTEEFLETSSLSQSFKHFEEKMDLLNVSSQSKLASPVVNKIVSALKSSRDQFEYEGDPRLNPRKCQMRDEPPSIPEQGKVVSVASNSHFHDTLTMDTSFLEDDTQELGKLKQVPYMSGENIQENIYTDECKSKTESTLNFTCCLHGASNEPVIDAEIVLFNDVKYAFLQHKTQVHVWRQERNKKWVKIFYHQVEDMFYLDKMCISMDDDNLVIVMLLNNGQNCCLQFLLFEKDARIIKLMENTHWLEERHSKDRVLLCGLDGLMFATAQNKGNHEVSLHAFLSLKENPRLMTAILGSTNSFLCSLCKIDKLPNALMGVNDSMLYIWHILEARLVTAVSLHPHDYLPIKNCFWATVEKGLIYFMTTCEGTKDFQVCQLLAANLATGFCQSAMTYTTLPSKSESGAIKIMKAAYLEPFLVVAHSNGAFIWSVTEEFCCAALSTQSKVTTISVSRDFENWGLLAVGNDIGFVNCYNLN